VLDAATKFLPTALAAARQCVAEEIAKLFELRERGALSSDEFDAQKQRLLSM
jgi:hypothetical protein